jgi:uncharacterized membrane protein
MLPRSSLNDKIFYSRNLAPAIIDLLLVAISVGAINTVISLLVAIRDAQSGYVLALLVFKAFVLPFLLLQVCCNVVSYASTLRIDLGAHSRPESAHWSGNAFTPRAQLIVFIFDIVQVCLTGALFSVVTASESPPEIVGVRELDEKISQIIITVSIIMCIWHALRIMWHFATKGLRSAKRFHAQFTAMHSAIIAMPIVITSHMDHLAVLAQHTRGLAPPDLALILLGGVGSLQALIFVLFYFRLGILFLTRAFDDQKLSTWPGASKAHEPRLKAQLDIGYFSNPGIILSKQEGKMAKENCADRVLRELIRVGTNTCFANPGTTELAIVDALARNLDLKSYLCLHENVATGAAHGYAIAAGKPAATLLHLGAGLANGAANLHNARIAGVPVINIVGDFPTWHVAQHSNLYTNVDAIASAVSGVVHRIKSPSEAGLGEFFNTTRAACAPSILIFPSDVQVAETQNVISTPVASPNRTILGGTAAQEVKQAVNGKRTALLLGGDALRATNLRAAQAIADNWRAELLAQPMTAYISRGRGNPRPRPVPYWAEKAVELFDKFEVMYLLELEIRLAHSGTVIGDPI